MCDIAGRIDVWRFRWCVSKASKRNEPTLVLSAAETRQGKRGLTSNAPICNVYLSTLEAGLCSLLIACSSILMRALRNPTARCYTFNRPLLIFVCTHRVPPLLFPFMFSFGFVFPLFMLVQVHLTLNSATTCRN